MSNIRLPSLLFPLGYNKKEGSNIKNYFFLCVILFVNSFITLRKEHFCGTITR